MVNKWTNDGERSVVDIRPRPGDNWRILDINGSLDAPSGGGRARETLWGRGKNGLEPRGLQYTGNPNDWTFNLMYPLNSANFLDSLGDCPFDVRARHRCDNLLNMTSYGSPGMLGYVEGTNNDYSYDNPLSVADGTGTDVKRQIAVTATKEVRYAPVAHDDISKTTSDADINRMLAIGFNRCAGDCGPAKSEEDEWLWVTDRDATPGYSGNAVAHLGYSIDRMETRNSVPIDPFTAADAIDVVFLGDRVVVFSSGKAPAYASFADILNGVVAPNLWSTSTGFSGIASPNFPAYASAPSGSTIFAVGAGGRIWKSTDGGISFTLIDNGATTSNALTAVDFADADLGYIGGASGTLLRYYKGAISRLTVSDTNGTLSANINVVRTPPGRSNEVYLGTAGGEVWRSRNATATRPTWENTPIPRKGSGTITDLAFAGYHGDVLFIIQTSADSNSRIYRDFAGGVGLSGTDVESVGDFTSPSNFKYNSIAPANQNMAMVGGQIHETYGYLGMVRANT